MNLPDDLVSQRIHRLHGYFSQLGVNGKRADSLIMQDLTLVKKPSWMWRVALRWHYRAQATAAIQLLDIEISQRARFVKDALLSIVQRTDRGLKTLASHNRLIADLTSHGIDCTKLHHGELPTSNYPAWLKTKILCHQFSPLTTALFSQNQNCLIKEVQEGADVNEQDAQGYTTAHFAAILGSAAALRILKEYGADFTIKTRLDGTVYDFLRHRGFEKDSEANIFSATALLEIWNERIDLNRNSYSCSTVHTALQNGHVPPVMLKTIESKDSPLCGQKEVVASRNITRGEYIIEYTGDVYTYKRHSDYVLELTDTTFIDAEKRGTIARFINHGPPNCYWYYTFYQGTPRTSIVALRNIAAGASLLVDYGSGYFRKREFHELNPQFLDNWITTITIQASAVEKAFSQIINNAEEYYIAEEQQRIYLYLYDFPDQLIRLLREGRLTLEATLEFLDAIKTHAKKWFGKDFPKEQHMQTLQRFQNTTNQGK